MRTLGFLFLVVLSLASCKKSNPADAAPARACRQGARIHRDDRPPAHRADRGAARCG